MEAYPGSFVNSGVEILCFLQNSEMRRDGKMGKYSLYETIPRMVVAAGC